MIITLINIDRRYFLWINEWNSYMLITIIIMMEIFMDLLCCCCLSIFFPLNNDFDRQSNQFYCYCCCEIIYWIEFIFIIIVDMWNESIIFEIDFNIYEIKNNEMIEYSILSKWKHYHIWTFIYCDNKDKKNCFVLLFSSI